MTTQKAPNPQVDFGFFASVPRSIRTEYKSLTPTQKWLYVCLKDLCGDHGTCYRALRTLADETDISTGMLSESIQVLHKAGLIHAEKKKRQSGGKEVWHITIIDIWIANGKIHPSKRSPAEQECSQNEQTTENVHCVNKNVHSVNDNSLVCSHSERECSLCETEERTYKKEHIEERTMKNIRGATAIADITASPTSSLSNLEYSSNPGPAVSMLVAPASRMKPARKKPDEVVSEKKATRVGGKKPVDLFEAAPIEVKAVITEWRSIFDHPIPSTPKLIEQATLIAAFRPAYGDIIGCRLWMYGSDTKKWYSTHGMHLGDVAREFEKFRSLASVPNIAPVVGRQISSFDDPNYDMSSEFYPSDAEKKARLAHATR